MNIWKEEWAYIVLLKVKRMFRRYRGLRKTGKMAQRYRPLLLILLLMLLITGAGTILVRQETEETTGYILPLCQIEMRHRLKGIETEAERMERVRMEAEAYDYPENVKGLLDKNPETIEFVEDYRAKKDQPAEDTVGDSLIPGEIPLLLQWDERWGYAPYGTSVVAVSGCGPTCMAMVAAGLRHDPTITPAKVAEYGTQNQYVDEENNNISIDLAIQTAVRFGISEEDAKNCAEEIRKIVRENWERTAADYGLTRRQIEEMRPAFSACFSVSTNRNEVMK